MAVVKLAQPGYDVNTAGDENLIYSSQWPLLKIYKQGSATVDVSQTSTITEHDLTFPPVFWYFSNATIDKWLGTGTMTNESRSEFFGPIGANASIKVSDSKLVYESGGFASGSLNLYYYLFGLDLTKQYTAPIIKVGAQSAGRASNRVFKIAKESKDVSSTDLADFVIHSKARSPLVHSVNPSPGVVKTLAVEHKLGYNPMFFGYTKGTDGFYTLIPTGTGGSSNFTSTENTVTFNDSGGKEMTIVILKDPFLVDYTVRVSV